MERFITLYNLLCKLTALVFFALALYRSEKIFIKARTRDVREILTTKIIQYEHNIRVKLISKFGLSMLFLCISFSRIRSGFKFISELDMWIWFAISTLLLIIGFIDYRFASPENED